MARNDAREKFVQFPDERAFDPVWSGTEDDFPSEDRKEKAGGGIGRELEEPGWPSLREERDVLMELCDKLDGK